MQSLNHALNLPDESIHIRPVLRTDIDALCESCWPGRPRSSVEQLIYRARQIATQGRGLGVVVVADDRKTMLGFGQLTMWPRGGEISDLMVAEQSRGLGIGTAIIQYLVQVARSMRAERVEIGAAYSNPRALILYRRLGFVDDHEVMLNLGQGPEPVVYLRLELPAYLP